MHIRIIKSISRNNLASIIRVRSTETGIVIIQPGLVAPELVHRPDMIDLIHVRHASIFLFEKTGVIRKINPSRRSDPVEIIDNQHLSASIAPVFRNAEAQCL